MIDKEQNFAFETTLSGLTYLKLISRAKEKGFKIILFFVYLESFELAQSRVAIRVSKGGHNIPPEIIERRYAKGIGNFKTYATKVDNWHLYDNTGPMYVLVGRMLGDKEEIFNFDIYNKIMSHEG